MAELYNSGIQLPLDLGPDSEAMLQTLNDVFDSLRALSNRFGDVVSINSNTAAFPSTSYVIADTSLGAITYTLLPADSVVAGVPITFKPTDASYNLTVDADGSELIDGATTAVVTYPDSLTLISDNYQWWII